MPLWPGILALFSYAALVVALVAAGALSFGLQKSYTSPAFTAAVTAITLAARLWADRDRGRFDRRREFFKVVAVGIRDGTGAEFPHLLRLCEGEMGTIVARRYLARRLAELFRLARRTCTIPDVGELLRLFSKDLYSPEKYLVQVVTPNHMDAAKRRVSMWIEEIEKRQQA